jgi:hypothetical protein
MSMAYQLYTIKSTRLGSPTLTIKADGRVSLNADAGDLMSRAGAKFVQILWDAESRMVALRPLVKQGESSYKLLVRPGKRRGTAFSALTFLRHIGWDLSKSATVSISWNEKEKILEASLPLSGFVIEGLK